LKAWSEDLAIRA